MRNVTLSPINNCGALLETLKLMNQYGLKINQFSNSTLKKLTEKLNLCSPFPKNSLMFSPNQTLPATNLSMILLKIYRNSKNIFLSLKYYVTPGSKKDIGRKFMLCQEQKLILNQKMLQ
jgi:hypothetical protein